MNDEQQQPTINIYGQPAWHFPARIVANREGLEALRVAIDNLLWNTNEKQTIREVFASDGEGYEITIERAPDDFLWSDYARPFYYEFADMYQPTEPPEDQEGDDTPRP